MQALRPRAKPLLHFRTHLFRPPRQRRRGRQRLRGAQAHRRGARPRKPCRRRHRRAGAGFRRAGGAWAMPQEAGIPFELGIIRNHYVGRTFIEPTDQIRHLGVRLKHNANRADLEGKRVILVDDFDRARHDLDQDRRDGPRRRRARSSYAHLQPADDAFLLLRHRHAGARQASRRTTTTSSEMAELHRRRQSRLSSRSTALPGDGRGRSATPQRRTSATPASPATIRSR